MGPDVEFGKDFKAAVINVLKEAKETMSKIKEKYDDNDSIKRESKKIQAIKKSQKNNSKVENTIISLAGRGKNQ